MTEWLIVWELEKVKNNSSRRDNDVSGKRRKGIPYERKGTCKVQEV